MRGSNLIRRHINRLFDDLEQKLKNQQHLSDQATEVQASIDKCAKFWSRLNDGERDFLNVARYALKDKKPWR